MSDTPLIRASYLAHRPEQAPEALAEAIAREQSLEILPELIPQELARVWLGQVLAVARVNEDCWRLEIGFPEALASAQLGQLLQLAYGNVSFYPRIRLIDLALPDGLLARFHGPSVGASGIRSRLEAPRRPLLIGVLKPRGSSAEHLAGIAQAFAAGGGDILKDDQNLVDEDLAAFEQRVRLCAEAIDRASQASGRPCLYFANVAGSGEHLRRQLEIVADLGIAGVVLCPWVMGLETASAAARDHGLMWLAHLAMAGSFTEPEDRGICPSLIFGLLPRLAGADLVVYPGSGGRLSLSRPELGERIEQRLLEPLAQLKSSLPCIGGGKDMDQATAGQRITAGGVVMGGALLRHGQALEAAVRSMIRRLASEA